MQNYFPFFFLLKLSAMAEFYSQRSEIAVARYRPFIHLFDDGNSSPA